MTTSPAIIISNIESPTAESEGLCTLLPPPIFSTNLSAVTADALDRVKELDGSVFKAVGQNQIRHIDLAGQTLKHADVSQLISALAPNSTLVTCILCQFCLFFLVNVCNEL